jgi:hypothetical protein
MLVEGAGRCGNEARRFEFPGGAARRFALLAVIFFIGSGHPVRVTLSVLQDLG